MARRYRQHTKAGLRRVMRSTMGKWKQGKLHSGSKKGRVVTSQSQAIAISLSEARAKGFRIRRRR